MKKTLLLSVLCVLLALPALAQPKSSLEFKVVDPDGNPVKDVEITAILNSTNVPLPSTKTKKKGKAYIHNAGWREFRIEIKHPELMLIKADFYVVRERSGAGSSELMGKDDTFYDFEKSGVLPIFMGGSKAKCTIVMGTKDQWRAELSQVSSGGEGGDSSGGDGFERTAEPIKGEHYEFGEAMQLFEKEDYSGALKSIKAYLAKEVEHLPESTFVHGQLLILNMDVEAGEPLVREYLANGPDDSFAFDWYGSWLEENNRKADAGKIYAMAANFITHENNRMVFIKLAANALPSGPHRMQVLELGLEQVPDDLGFLMNLRGEYRAAKMKDKVREINEILKTKDPTAAAIAMYEDAWSAFQRKHYKTALRLATDTYHIDETRYDALKLRAVCLEKLKRYVDAGKTYAAYLALVPDDKDAALLKQKADVFRSMGKQLEEMELEN